MDCSNCGRPLAPGAQRCVYCAHGTKIQRREELVIPREAMAPRKSRFPWGKLVVALVFGALIVAAFLHPDVNAKLKQLLGRF